MSDVLLRSRSLQGPRVTRGSGVCGASGELIKCGCANDVHEERDIISWLEV